MMNLGAQMDILLVLNVATVTINASRLSYARFACKEFLCLIVAF
jgi:hypothetical protein